MVKTSATLWWFNGVFSWDKKPTKFVILLGFTLW
jgi:hypothetical protein